MRVAIYARVSTADKDQDPETQLIALREFVQAQAWELEGEYVDHASATDLKGRVEWRQVLDLASKRKVDLVLVWRLDRAFRSVLDAANTLERLRTWKVGLRSYAEPWLDTTSPFGEALFYITSAYAQLEKGILVERVKAGMARAKRQGKRFGRKGGTWAPDFEARWSAMEPAIRAGRISHSEAARQLRVSRATILRRLAVQTGVPLTPSEPHISEGVAAP